MLARSDIQSLAGVDRRAVLHLEGRNYGFSMQPEGFEKDATAPVHF